MRARDRHHLAIGQRKVVDAGLEIDGQPHAVGDRLGLAAHAGRIEQQWRAIAAQPIERQIGGDVEISDDPVIDVLVNGDDAGADRFRRRVRREVLAGEAHGAAAALVDAADDLDEGGFAGAVGAHQHGHFAGMQLQRDAAKHLVAAKGFPQSLYAEHGIADHAFLPDHDAMVYVGNCQHD